MKSKVFYETPELYELELEQEGILCLSDADGGINPLTPNHDWSNLFN